MTQFDKMFNSLAFLQGPCNGLEYEIKQEILAKLDYPFNRLPIGRTQKLMAYNPYKAKQKFLWGVQ